MCAGPRSKTSDSDSDSLRGIAVFNQTAARLTRPAAQRDSEAALAAWARLASHLISYWPHAVEQRNRELTRVLYDDATLQAFAAEPTLAPRIAADGCRLACGLAATCHHDAHTFATLIETLAAFADAPEHSWRLIAHGALPSLILASAAPSDASASASRALKALNYDLICQARSDKVAAPWR